MFKNVLQYFMNDMFIYKTPDLNIMDTFDAIQKRWGCRRYLKKDIEQEKIALILDAARYAPSAGNLQDRTFILVKKQEIKTEVANACANQSWMQDAAAQIVVVFENRKNKKFFGDKGENTYGIQDTSFSVENILLMATDLGLGCSLVVGFNEEKLKEILEIPDPSVPYAVITLGYAAETVKPSAKYDLEKFVFYDKYGRKVESFALMSGEWSTVRDELAAKGVRNTKNFASRMMDKIKEMFSKNKKEEQVQDHFMEETAMSPKDEDMEEVKGDIPRELPKKSFLRK
jgi:nitroreductase